MTLLDHQRTERLGDAVRSVHVHIEDEVEVFFLRLHERPGDRDSGVIHDAIQPSSRLADAPHSCGDLLRPGHIKTHRVHVLDGIQHQQVCLLAGTRVNEIAGRREVLGDLPPNARAGARD
jgi:hypothetical protein